MIKPNFILIKQRIFLKKNKLPNSESSIKGNILYLKGMNYAYTLDCDMALVYFNQAISAYRLGKDPLSQMNIKLAYLNKAYCLIEMNNLKDAERFLILSQVKRSDIYASASAPQIYSDILNQFVVLGFAKILALRNNFNRSNEVLLSILKLQDKSNISDTDTDICLLLSHNFLKMKDIEKSRYFDDLYQRKMAEKNKIQIEILNNLLLQNKKNADQKIQQQNNEIVKLTIILILFSTALSLVLAHKVRKIRKANEFIRNGLYRSCN
ncbi:hypothetical protein [Chryseobacterium proteolyticum]|uniref:hypothetical protein n=1 Tax=Chryseobacterium proteolyticum TaxID=118127 RepID=UPI0039833F92